MSKRVAIGWIISSLGMALWLYGYCLSNRPALIDWRAIAPWWIADFLPKIECEIGTALEFVGMVPKYWPAQR